MANEYKWPRVSSFDVEKVHRLCTFESALTFQIKGRFRGREGVRLCLATPSHVLKTLKKGQKLFDSHKREKLPEFKPIWEVKKFKFLPLR